VLALVPARGGSKGIPRKNLATLCGRPLIAWTIDCARRARGVERVVVTTDCPEIAAAARSAGAEAPFLRPAALARDATPGIDPLLHALDWLAYHESYRPEWVLNLQPTSPLRAPEDIDAAFELAQKPGVASVISVTPAASHPYWCKRIESDGRLADFLDDAPETSRRQELPEAYALNGAIYLARREALKRERSFYTERSFALVMPRERSVDIDTPFDLELAEWLLARAQSRTARITSR
jgi:CMP-N-acetylneuraminic acid synthetase